MISDTAFHMIKNEMNALTLHSPFYEVYVSIYVLKPDVIRTSVTKHSPEIPIHSWAIAPGDTEMPLEGMDRQEISELFERPSYQLEESDTQLLLTTEKIKLVINKAHLHFTWYAIDEETKEEVWAAEDRSTQAYFFQIAKKAPVSHYLTRKPGELYFGLGEKTGNVNKYGERYRMLNIDAMGYDAEKTDPLYKHIPYCVTYSQSSGLAYGLYYDDYNECAFDLGKEKDNYHGSYRYFETRSEFLDYYFILGPDVPEVTKTFSWLTGRPARMPKWSYGYSGSTMTYTDEPRSQERLGEFIKNCRTHNIPCSSFHLSSGYTSIQDKRYVFHWNREKFPEPKRFAEDFHKEGINIIANIKPSLLVNHPKFKEAAEQGMTIKNENEEPLQQQFWDDLGVYLDFTNEKTIEWWKENVKEQLLHNGIDSTWNDNNEFEVWDPDAVIDLFGKKGRFQDHRAIFPMLMTKVSLAAQLEHNPGRRPFLVTRSGSAGIGRYAQTWTGDNDTSWHTLKYNIKMAIGLSLSGVYNFGHDTGGFAGGAPEPELLLRWIQSNIYYPRFTIHSWNDDNTVNEPWMYPEITEKVSGTMNWHRRLAGYLFSIGNHSSAEYEPIIRPVFYNFPKDPVTYKENDEFMLGRDLLVCTIVEPEQRERTVYLPAHAGGWYDLYTETWYEGGQNVSVPAPLEYTPVMVKGGSILPIEEETQVRVQLYPAAAGTSVSFSYCTSTEADGKEETAQFDMTMETSESAISVFIHKTGTAESMPQQFAFHMPSSDTRTLWINGEETALFHT